MAKFDEQQFLQDYANAPQRAFRMLMDGYRDLMFAFCRRATNTNEDAEDLAQEVFMRVWKGLNSFKGNASLNTWIYRIAWNVCATHIDSKGRKPEQLSYEENPTSEDEGFAFPELHVPPEAGQFEKKQLIEYLFEQIPEQHKLALTLYYMQELTYDDTPQVTGWKMGTVKATMSRAKESMRKAAELAG